MNDERRYDETEIEEIFRRPSPATEPCARSEAEPEG